MLHILLVRHGETEWNKERRYQGQVDIPLSIIGKQQAALVAESLEGRKIDVIYASDLKRAWQTASAITQKNGLDISSEPRLREMGFGVLEGLTWDEAQENGLYFTASIGHSFDLMEKLSMSLGALVSYNDESDYAVGDYSEWHNYELSASAEYAITDQISVSPSFLYSSGISDEAKDAIDSEMVGGVSVTLTF